MTDDPPHLWVLCLEPLPGGPPPAVRVRRLLKAALRQYRLRCRVVREPTPEEVERFGRPGCLADEWEDR